MAERATIVLPDRFASFAALKEYCEDRDHADYSELRCGELLDTFRKGEISLAVSQDLSSRARLQDWKLSQVATEGCRENGIVLWRMEERPDFRAWGTHRWILREDGIVFLSGGSYDMDETDGRVDFEGRS